VFPGAQRRQRQRTVTMTFDVDWPLIALGVPAPRLIRAAMADVFRRSDPRLAARRLVSWSLVRSGHLDHDAGNIFDAIMTSCEDHGITCIFYFIAGDGRGDIDGSYTIEHPWVRRLLRRIHTRGHVVGIHPTYATFRDGCRLRREVDRLKTVCDREGIHQSHWGGRQHYLRWEPPTTWQLYEDVGLDYDSTMAYADMPGFRCGTSYEFPVYNVGARQPLRLRERPLLAMDANLFGERSKSGLALDTDAAVDVIAGLVEACDRYAGDITLLWHNNWLLRAPVSAAYRRTLPLVARSQPARAAEGRFS
jgi:hypothetical protein